MKFVLMLLLIGLIGSGCIGPTTEKVVSIPVITQTSELADTLVKNYHKEGWGISGYTYNRNHMYLKIGEISSPMIYELSDHYPFEQDKATIESTKDSNHILGIFFKFLF